LGRGVFPGSKGQAVRVAGALGAEAAGPDEEGRDVRILHRLRGRPSNQKLEEKARQKAMKFRDHYMPVARCEAKPSAVTAQAQKYRIA
jgi:hypothetical protein